MNCYIHNYKPAVTECPECGMGLCRDCVDNAVYYKNNRPLCHDCSLNAAANDLASLKRQKVWSFIKFIFSSIFLLIGLSIYESTGDIINAWIYAGIAGLPSAFKSTRESKSEKIRRSVRDAVTTDMIDSSFNFFVDILIRLLIIIVIAPISATFLTIKNLFVFIGSFSKIKRTQQIYDHLNKELDIVKDTDDTPSLQQTNLTYAGIQENVTSQYNESIDSELPPTNLSQPLPSNIVPNASETYEESFIEETGSNKKIYFIVGGVIVVILLAFGYYFWYMPYAKDRDALRTYVIANNVFLRSSETAGVEYNILDKIPYGAEIITYEKGAEWAHVKANGTEGYMASTYLLDSGDFHLLNSVWGDADSRECIESSKCRLAILDLYKTNNLTGGTSGWQIYTKQKDVKPNTVAYPRIYDKYSKFTDFIFIIKNNITGDREVVGYSFDDETEEPIFRFMEDAPYEGYINSVKVRRNSLTILFDNNLKKIIQL